MSGDELRRWAIETAVRLLPDGRPDEIVDAAKKFEAYVLLQWHPAPKAPGEVFQA